MAYKSFQGKWRVFGDEPTISILPTGLICFNKVCYERFVGSHHPVKDKPAYQYVKLYYDPETKKIAFAFLMEKTGEFVFPIRLAKTGLLAIISGKAFLSYFGIKYEEKARSYPVHETFLPASGSGYSRRRVKGIEIHLDEYMTEKIDPTLI